MVYLCTYVQINLVIFYPKVNLICGYIFFVLLIIFYYFFCFDIIFIINLLSENVSFILSIDKNFTTSLIWWKNLVQFWLKKDTVQALNVSLSLFTFPIWEMSFEKVANNSTTTTTTAAVTTSTPSEWVKGLNLSLTHTHFHLSYLTMFIAANPRDDKLQKHHIEKFSLWEY